MSMRCAGKTMIELEQLYWGHDGGQYRVLGASPQAPADEVARFREQLGTPDGLSEIKPFLLSVPVGDRLIMMCGQQGRRDNIGRKTLFFHVLIGSRAECTQHCINAYSLWKNGFFKAEYVDGTPGGPLSVQILPETPIPGAEVPPWSGEKLAIRSAAPENELVCRMVGTRINDVPWAGFSWNPLDDFLLYAISRYAAVPKDRPCHDLNKTTVERPENAPIKPSVPHRMKEEKIKRTSPFSVILLLILLIVSLGFNCWFVWQRHTGKKRPQSTTTTVKTKTAEALPAVPPPQKNATKSADKPEQPPSIPKATFDWEKKIKKTTDIKRIWGDKGKGGNPKDFEFLKELKAIAEGQKR